MSGDREGTTLGQKLATFAPFTAAEIRAGAWRDIGTSEDYWKLANQAEAAEPNDPMKQRLLILELIDQARTKSGLPSLGL